MPTYQKIGDQAEIKPKPAQPSPSSVTKTSAMEQIVGDQVNLSRTAIVSPSSVTTKGSYQVVGDACPMNQNPVKSIGNSQQLPFSDRAIAQSEVGQAKPKV